MSITKEKHESSTSGLAMDLLPVPPGEELDSSSGRLGLRIQDLGFLGPGKEALVPRPSARVEGRPQASRHVLSFEGGKNGKNRRRKENRSRQAVQTGRRNNGQATSKINAMPRAEAGEEGQVSIGT
jgi:hypothetical protein